MSTKVNPTIQTKWGKADVWNTGYYTISDNSKGHYRELLHRLIFEEVHKCTLLSKSTNAKSTAEKYGYDLEDLM